VTVVYCSENHFIQQTLSVRVLKVRCRAHLRFKIKCIYYVPSGYDVCRYLYNRRTANFIMILAATLRWFTAGGAIRIAVRQLSQTWKLRNYDVIDDVITRKL